jgi:formylglycine-generating enzyme required for sulfatase activity
MGSIWETRVSDYATFTRESGRDDHRAASFPQTPDHPVVDISREDAQAFCKWLSERERKDERIARTHEYRLPSDMEWSKMLGLAEEEGISPGWRDARKKAIFPWGDVWPPDQAAGNFADAPATRLSGSGLDRNIQGYSDGFVFTSPVGSFPANSAGFYDLSGNVQEWVGDEYLKNGKNVLGVLRGGGWNSFQAESLFSGSRNAVPPTFRDSIYGFRVLLAKIPQKIKSPTLQ